MDGPVEVTKQLFVRPLRNDVTREEVQDHFSRAAPVVEVRLMEGYAFVTFENEDDAKQALELLNDAEFNGENYKLNLLRKEEKIHVVNTVFNHQLGRRYCMAGYQRFR